MISIFKEITKEKICILTKTNFNKHHTKFQTSQKEHKFRNTNYKFCWSKNNSRKASLNSVRGSGCRYCKPNLAGFGKFSWFQAVWIYKASFWEWVNMAFFREGRIMIDKRRKPMRSSSILSRNFSFKIHFGQISGLDRKSGIFLSRGRSRPAATCKMERFVVIFNGVQPLTIITKRSILDVFEKIFLKTTFVCYLTQISCKS